jgi:hypothetical protein
MSANSKPIPFITVQTLAGKMSDPFPVPADTNVSTLRDSILLTKNLGMECPQNIAELKFTIQHENESFTILDNDKKVHEYIMNDPKKVYTLHAVCRERRYIGSFKTDPIYSGSTLLGISCNGSILFVSDVTDARNSSIYMYSIKNGKLLGKYEGTGGPETQLFFAEDIMVYGNKLFVPNVNTHSVKVLKIEPVINDPSLPRLSYLPRNDIKLKPGDNMGTLNKPHGVFVANNKIYICDVADCRIVIFSITTQTEDFLTYTFHASFGREGTQNDEFNNPLFIYVSNGRIYVSDYFNHCVKIFSEETYQWLHTIGTGKEGTGKYEFKTPTFLCVDQNNLFVSDEGNRRLQWFTVEGDDNITVTYKDSIHPKEKNHAEHRLPRGMCVLHNKILYVSYGNRIEMFNIIAENNNNKSILGGKRTYKRKNKRRKRTLKATTRLFKKK